MFLILIFIIVSISKQLSVIIQLFGDKINNDNLHSQDISGKINDVSQELGRQYKYRELKDKELKDKEAEAEAKINAEKLHITNKPNNTLTNKELVELENVKIRIVEILGDYHIEIASISVSVGEQLMLYEIVPKSGVRISKIKSLENEISLSLDTEFSFTGTRIIAPIPGKGTIGIEVPKNIAADDAELE
jgi:DNA segregation ATPase FtsK/SpoIIIE-like protein